MGIAASRPLAGSRKASTEGVLDRLDLAVGTGVARHRQEVGHREDVLLKHVIGLLVPDAGTVEIEGEEFWKAGRVRRDEIRRKFGMSFQEGALFDSMSVGENIAFPLVPTRGSRPESARGRSAWA
jgi:phospholipid/cholesterol/gamma-HCH transport system ATP-binding protein